MYTLRKFWRYNKASLGELVPLEILGKNQQGLQLWVDDKQITYILTEELN